MFPEGAQDPLQRREEAGNEAKVPTLRGEDGYVSSEGACPVAGHNLGLDRADTPFRFSQGPGEQFIIVWQVLGTLPDSLERGSLAGPSEPVLVKIPTGRLGCYCGRVVLGRPLRASTPDPFGTHTQRCLPLPEERSNRPLSLVATFLSEALFSQGFGHRGGQFGTPGAFIVSTSLSLLPSPAAWLLVGP